MNANPWQQTVRDSVQQHGLQTDTYTRYIDLVAEVGELGKELLLGSQYGTQPLHPTANTAAELGDVLFLLCCVANALDVNMDAALQATGHAG